MADGVNCGNCGAPVQGQPGVMRCPYCGGRVDIPLVAAPPRQLLEEERPEERDRARRHDNYDEDNEPEERSESSGANVGAIIGAVVAFVVVSIMIGALVSSRSKKKTSAKDERRPVTAVATNQTKTKPAPPPSDTESVVVPSCTCAFGDGQSTPLVTLSLKAPPIVDPLRPLYLGIKRQSGFTTELRTSTLQISSPTVLSPPDGTFPTHMGIACDAGVYVLVADKVATGWSSVSATWKWTTALPATMVDGADAGAPPPPKNTVFSTFCTPLATQNGNATIALAGGRRATLSLKDGKLR
jgi:uncharacterized Zn finger protein (UPF0148 family)